MCVFCEKLGKDSSSWIHSTDHFFVVEDAYPVTKGHLLIISKEHRKDYFDLSFDEVNSLVHLIDEMKNYLEHDKTITGYNIGMNCGYSAGQTIDHFHCHLIPRRDGDMEHPEGGVRGVIPEKQKYGKYL